MLKENLMTNNFKSLAIAVGLATMIASCNSAENKNGEEAEIEASERVLLDPVETEAPNTDYKPAFEGQTRIAGVKTDTPYEGRVLSEDLNSPWGITTLPDGRFLITEKEGT